MDAVAAMHVALELDNIGYLHYAPIVCGECVFVITVRHLDDTQSQGLSLRWQSFKKVLKKRAGSSVLSKLVRESINITNFYESSQISLKRGLYLCYLKLHSSLNQITVVVPDNLPSMLPFVHVRENPHVTKEEWQWIKRINSEDDLLPSDKQSLLHSAISAAIQTLLHDLDIDSDLVPGHRLYHAEIIEPNTDISIILILPRAEDVCSAPTACWLPPETEPELRRGCSCIPLTAFEMLHMLTYRPEFFTTYCRLSVFIDHFLMITQFEQRQCLMEKDAFVYQTLIDCLTTHQKELDEIWTQTRWLTRIAAEARDKQSKCPTNVVPVGALLAPFAGSRISSIADSPATDESNEIGYHSENEGRDNSCPFEPVHLFRRSLSLTETMPGYADLDRLYKRQELPQCLRKGAYNSETSTSAGSASSNGCSNPVSVSVSAAYDCDLPEGTVVHLAINGSTTSKRVVELVLEKLKMVKRHGKEHELNALHFCLVVVVGARERRLKDDFVVARLQNPWNRGRLFVRRRTAFLAAVKLGNEATV